MYKVKFEGFFSCGVCRKTDNLVEMYRVLGKKEWGYAQLSGVASRLKDLMGYEVRYKEMVRVKTAKGSVGYRARLPWATQKYIDLDVKEIEKQLEKTGKVKIYLKQLYPGRKDLPDWVMESAIVVEKV